MLSVDTYLHKCYNYYNYMVLFYYFIYTGLTARGEHYENTRLHRHE